MVAEGDLLDAVPRDRLPENFLELLAPAGQRSLEDSLERIADESATVGSRPPPMSYHAESRLASYDAQGIDAQFINPTYASNPFASAMRSKRPDLARRTLEAFNTRSSQAVAGHTDRSIPTMMVDVSDVDWSVRELTRLRAAGSRTFPVRAERLPHFLTTIDSITMGPRGANFGIGSGDYRLPLKPSEYMRRAVRVTPLASSDPLRPTFDMVPEELLVFSSDVPHPEGRDRAVCICEEQLAGVSAERRELFFGGEIARLLGVWFTRPYMSVSGRPTMRAAKRIAIALCAYVAIVVAFESLIGILQPTSGTTLVITTRDRGGNAHERVLARLENGGQIYVAANHWPRGWYERALKNPDVRIEVDGKKSARRAVPVSGEERERVERDNSLGLMFRILTGFPPRSFLRLDPRE